MDALRDVSRALLLFSQEASRAATVEDAAWTM
jgi:hypothetical protein